MTNSKDKVDVGLDIAGLRLYPIRPVFTIG